MDTVWRAYKTTIVRKTVWSCSGDNFSAVKLVTIKKKREESKIKIIGFGLRERKSREREGITYL